MRREITRWQEQLRSKVEECLKPYIYGYYMQKSSNTAAHLPVIEGIYTKRSARVKTRF